MPGTVSQTFVASLEDPVEQRCFVVAALLNEFNRSGLAQLIADLAIQKRPRADQLKPSRDPSAALRGYPITTADLSDFLDIWVGANVARLSDHQPYTHVVDPRWGERCLLEPKLRPAVQDIKDRLLALAARERTNQFVVRRTRLDDSSLRNRLVVRCGIYLGETDAIESLMTTFGKVYAWGGDYRPKPNELLPLQAPMAAIDTLPGPLRAKWVSWAIEHSYQVVQHPCAELLQQVARDLSVQNRDLRLQAGVLLVLAHDTLQMGDLFADPADPFDLQIQALAALRCGNWDEARRLARAAHGASSGNTKKKPRLEGPAAPLLTLVLASGTAEDKSIAELQSAAQRTSRLKELMAAVGGERARDAIAPLINPFARGLEIQNGLALLLSAAFWPVYPPSDPAAAQLKHHLGVVGRQEATQFKVGGFPWVSDQLANAVAAIVSPAEGGATVPPPHSLMNLWTVQPAWQVGLEKLERLLDRTTTSAASYAASETRPGRLAFVLTIMAGRPAPLLPSHFAIEALFQKRQGSKWSAGRAVSLQKLLEGSTDAPVTDADRKVIPTIAAYKSWAGQSHSFTPASLAALVGHPCVFWAGDPSFRPVKVVEGQSELRVSQNNEGFRFEIEPTPETSGYGVVRPETDTLVVVSFTEAQIEAMQAIRSLPVIPTHAHERLGATISRLSGLYHIQSAGEFVGVSAHSQEVSADGRPVLMLSRGNPGMTIVVGVEPLGPQGPRLVPGQGLANLAAEVDGQRLTCQRNLDDESRLTGTLSRFHEALTFPDKGNTLQFDDFGKCLEVIRVLNEAALAEAVVVRWSDGEPVSVLGKVDFGNLRLEIKTVGQWFELTGQANLDEGLVLSMADLIEQNILKRGYVRLPDGRYVSVAPDLLRHLRALSSVAGKSAVGQLSLPANALGFVGGWLNDLKRDHKLKSDAGSSKQLARIDAAFRRDPVLPATLEAEFRAYQETGFAFLSRLSSFGAGAILADDMGLGKTLMTLALLLERADMGPALVVAPVSVKANWLDEGLRFAPTLGFVSIDSAPLKSRGAFDVVVCSYASMVQNIEVLEKMKWATLILDEAQVLKNPSTLRAQAACRLNAQTRICLTGTPIENHLGDLYSLMNIANPGLLGSAKEFEERFGKPIQREGDQVAREALLAVISPFVLRRRKGDVLKELPSRTEILHEVEPEAPERAFLEALRRKALRALQSAEAKGESAIHILAELTRLRRAACHPRLVAPDTDVGGAKLEALVSLVHDLRSGQHRALIFSQFVDFLAIVRDRFKTEGIAFEYLDGSCTEKARTDSVKAFQKGQGDVFLISLKAGGFGLNLTAADYVIHLDPWWNPAVEDQASDRAHRFGQTRPVTIYRLVTVGSVEQKVLALHAKKRDLAENILRETSTPTPLDATALMGLLAP